MSISQRGRREIIVLSAAAWLVLLAPVPLSLNGSAIVFTAIVVALGAGLLQSTGWLALRRAGDLDEREVQLRDHGYRIAFRLLLPVIVLLVAGAAVSAVEIGQPNVHLPGLMRPRPLIALLLFLGLAPTAVLGWVAGDAAAGADARRSLSRLWLLVGGAALTVAILWWATLIFVPGRVEVAELVPAGNYAANGLTCGQYAASEDAGAGFGASLRMLATVCWNGQQAFVVDAPISPPPYRLGDWAFPYISACSSTGYDDFAQVRDIRCTSFIDAAGTMHYQMIGDLRLATISVRTMVINLMIDRSGRVLSFGGS